MAKDCSKEKGCATEGMKPCCACPETREARDKCVFLFGPEAAECHEYIRRHQECLKAYGFPDFDK